MEPGLFALVTNTVFSTLTGGSAAVYQQAFDAWRRWCQVNAHDPLYLNAEAVQTCLVAMPVGSATCNGRLSALRALACTLARACPTPERLDAYHSLLKLRLPPGENQLQPKHAPCALAFDATVWASHRLQDRRNRALIAVLSAGLHETEAAALCWNALDLGAHIIQTARGEFTLSPAAVSALRSWRDTCQQKRQYVFCAIRGRKRLGDDRPMSRQTVAAIMRATGK
jgi:integrase